MARCLESTVCICTAALVTDVVLQELNVTMIMDREIVYRLAFAGKHFCEWYVVSVFLP